MSFRRKFTIQRTTGGEYDDNGIWQKGETEEIEIMASVQPLSLASLNEYNQIFPEGIRTVNAVKIYTDTRLYPEKQGTPAQNADVLLYMDRKYKIITCHAYQSGVISHYKAYAQEVDT